MLKPGKQLRRQSWIQWLLGAMILVLVNIISGFLFTRFYLTADKRFTLSPTTKEFLGKLDDIVYVKVYLEGDLPATFEKLSKSTKELLDEFRAYSRGNLEYEFIDPSANPDVKERNKIYVQLTDAGIQPTNIREGGKGEAIEKIIFPGAIFTYRNNDYPLLLLKNLAGGSPEDMLNASLQTLEYEITNTIRKITVSNRPKVGFLQGHGELKTIELTDIARSLSEFYTVDTVRIGGFLKSLDAYKAIIIAQPDTAFDEKDKFVLDQFAMKGGRILWLIDRMAVSMDSLKNKEGTTVAVPLQVNLEDQLFRYGVRINPDLIQDVIAAPIPVTTGYIGNQPQQRLLPWFFFPLIAPEPVHPVVNNLNLIRFQFVSSIDTLKVKDIRKQVLLTTSPYCKVVYSPVRISLGMMRLQGDPNLYHQKYLPVAVLLEGKFTSLYKNRLPPELAASNEFNFKESSDPTKMIVVSDGDVIRNEYKKTGMVYPLGYDRFTRQTYGNKAFILNCVDYLCDETGLLNLRSREFKLRLLDQSRVEQERLKWQVINVGGPLSMILIFGLLKAILRKRRFSY